MFSFRGESDISLFLLTLTCVKVWETTKQQDDNLHVEHMGLCGSGRFLQHPSVLPVQPHSLFSKLESVEEFSLENLS